MRTLIKWAWGLFYGLFLCKHDWQHSRNIYGDEINYLNARSIWHCTVCRSAQFRDYLVKREGID